MLSLYTKTYTDSFAIMRYLCSCET